jgi:hypothetical protein
MCIVFTTVYLSNVTTTPSAGTWYARHKKVIFFFLCVNPCGYGMNGSQLVVRNYMREGLERGVEGDNYDVLRDAIAGRF